MFIGISFPDSQDYLFAIDNSLQLLLLSCGHQAFIINAKRLDFSFLTQMKVFDKILEKIGSVASY